MCGGIVKCHKTALVPYFINLFYNGSGLTLPVVSGNFSLVIGDEAASRCVQNLPRQKQTANDAEKQHKKAATSWNAPIMTWLFVLRPLAAPPSAAANPVVLAPNSRHFHAGQIPGNRVVACQEFKRAPLLIGIPNWAKKKLFAQ